MARRSGPMHSGGPSYGSPGEYYSHEDPPARYFGSPQSPLGYENGSSRPGGFQDMHAAMPPRPRGSQPSPQNGDFHFGPRHIVLPPKSEPYGGRGVLVKLDDPSEETADSLRYQGLGKRTWKDKMCRLVLSGFEPRDIAACGRKSVRIPDPEYNLRSREILAERDAYVARREEGLRAMREVYESPAARRQAIRAQQQRQGRMQPPPEECDDEEYDEDPYNIDEMDSNMYGRGRA